MQRSRKVLVVEGNTETHAVLDAVLSPQGHSVARTTVSRLPRDVSETDLLVVDVDEVTSLADLPESPTILVGSFRVRHDSRDHRFLAKPFEYPDLVHAVHSLLHETAAATGGLSRGATGFSTEPSVGGDGWAQPEKRAA